MHRRAEEARFDVPDDTRREADEKDAPEKAPVRPCERLRARLGPFSLSGALGGPERRTGRFPARVGVRCRAGGAGYRASTEPLPHNQGEAHTQADAPDTPERVSGAS